MLFPCVGHLKRVGIVQRHCADGDVRAPPHAEPRAVRGRPRPHSGPARNVHCGRGRPRTSTRRTLGGARTSSSAFRPCTKRPLRAGTPAHLHTPNPARCADVLVRIPALHETSIAGEDARAPPHAEPCAVRGRPRPHSGPGQPPIAGGDARAPPHAEPRAVRGRPRPHSGPGQTPIAGGDARVPPHAEPRAVRGRPRPHSGLAQT